MLDVCLFSLAAGIVIVFRAPGAFSERGAVQGIGIILLFLWVFIEALLLSSFGTTPGKFMLKITVLPPPSGSVSYSDALRRSIKVWARGLGAGLPVVNLIALALAHGHLTRNGTTSWDSEGGFAVKHERIGVARVAAVTLFFIVFVLLMAIARAA
jgi:hypothetical protein